LRRNSNKRARAAVARQPTRRYGDAGRPAKTRCPDEVFLVSGSATASTNEGLAGELNPPVRTLLGPGPSATHPRVYRAMTAPVLGHLDPAYLQILAEIQSMLRAAFRTQNPMTIALPGTGTTGMEAAMANLLEPGDTIVIGVAGYFGERMCDMAQRYGASVVRVDTDWGTIVESERMAAAIRGAGRVKAVAIVQGETSTGVLQPVHEVARAAHQAGALMIVDAVTSFCTSELAVDEWELDYVYSCTQKGLSCPPGLAPVTVSERAMDAVRGRQTPCTNWYLDLTLLAKYWGPEHVYHHTSSATLSYALHEGLRVVLDEGLPQRVARHQRNAAAFHAACEAMGMPLAVEARYRLPALSTVRIPEGVDDAASRAWLLRERGIEVGGGLGAFRGKVWRVGLMGYSSTAENVMLIAGALAQAAGAQGKRVDAEAGAAAAARLLFG
jgi:alanine-glyoxylate transaminase/serine-glyoxylate transaminase/serine-pyruvate transaminase